MPKSALEKAAEFYQEKGDDFWASFSYYQRFGHVYIDYECMGMMRPCVEADPFNFCFPADADAFYIEYAFGDAATPKLVRIMQAAHPGIKRFGFTRTPRKEDVHFYNIDSFRRKTDGLV